MPQHSRAFATGEASIFFCALVAPFRRYGEPYITRQAFFVRSLEVYGCYTTDIHAIST